MKRVKDLPYFKKIREVREFEFGVFYYFDGLVISEIQEGVCFDCNLAKGAVAAAKEIFGEETPIAYISNRINSYTVVPTEWLKFYKNRHQLSYYSVVGSTQGSFASIVLEKMFFKESLRQFNDLEAAVTWSLDRIKEEKEPLS